MSVIRSQFASGGFARCGHQVSEPLRLASAANSVAGSAAEREPVLFPDDGWLARFALALFGGESLFDADPPGLSMPRRPPKGNGVGSGGGGRG